MGSKKMGISVREKMDTFSLSFDTKELLESINLNITENLGSSVYSNGKRAWFGKDKPQTLLQIDTQLRKKYNIPEDNKLICCVHYPPEKNQNNKYIEKSLKIKENKESIFHRFIISTIHEVCYTSFQTIEPEAIEMKSWVSYKTPDMIGGMLSYEFKNEKNLCIPPKKGHRQIRKIKNLENRHVLVFDYLVSKRQYQELGNLLKKSSPEISDENVNSALEVLRDS